MLFLETPIFTELITEFLSPESYRALQIALFLRPEQGAVIVGTGGLRKVRWGIGARGKRGGLRVIYFWAKPSDIIYLLLAYDKTQQDDLTAKQARLLEKLVAKEFPDE